jgi:predicted PurR-regulated permease PerM
VLFGGTLFGVIGAILAVPTAATIQIGFQEWVRYTNNRRAEAVLGGGAGGLEGAVPPQGA